MYLSYRLKVTVAVVGALAAMVVAGVVALSIRDDDTSDSERSGAPPAAEATTTTTDDVVDAPAEHLEEIEYPPGVVAGTLTDAQIAACEGHAASVNEMLGLFSEPSDATSEVLAAYQPAVAALNNECPGVGDGTRTALYDWLGERSFAVVVADPTSPEGGEPAPLDDPSLEGFELIDGAETP